MRKLSASIAALGLMAACGAHAAGAYVGGSLSAPDYSNTINGLGGDGGGKGLGAKIYGGYQITPNFAVEGGYFNLGRSKNLDGGSVRGQGLYVDGVGSISFAPQWEAYGSLGLAEARFRTPDGNDSSPAVKVGLGVQYDLTPTTALRVGYERYHFTDAFDGKANVGQATAGIKLAF